MAAAMLVLGFDMTILNVALPTMGAERGASTGGQLLFVLPGHLRTVLGNSPRQAVSGCCR